MNMILEQINKNLKKLKKVPKNSKLVCTSSIKKR